MRGRGLLLEGGQTHFKDGHDCERVSPPGLPGTHSGAHEEGSGSRDLRLSGGHDPQGKMHLFEVLAANSVHDPVTLIPDFESLESGPFNNQAH